MTVDFQLTFTARCDLNDAFDDYNTMMEWNPDYDPNKAIYDAINENLICPQDVDVPEDVFEQFAKALKTRIGGVQLEMELN